MKEEHHKKIQMWPNVIHFLFSFLFKTGIKIYNEVYNIEVKYVTISQKTEGALNGIILSEGHISLFTTGKLLSHRCTLYFQMNPGNLIPSKSDP